MDLVKAHDHDKGKLYPVSVVSTIWYSYALSYYVYS